MRSYFYGSIKSDYVQAARLERKFKAAIIFLEDHWCEENVFKVLKFTESEIELFQEWSDTDEEYREVYPDRHMFFTFEINSLKLIARDAGVLLAEEGKIEGEADFDEVQVMKQGIKERLLQHFDKSWDILINERGYAVKRLEGEKLKESQELWEALMSDKVCEADWMC